MFSVSDEAGDKNIFIDFSYFLKLSITSLGMADSCMQPPVILVEETISTCTSSSTLEKYFNEHVFYGCAVTGHEYICLI
jgi:hypothetical protein